MEIYVQIYLIFTFYLSWFSVKIYHIHWFCTYRSFNTAIDDVTN